MNATVKEVADRMRADGGPMSDAEIEFLRDVQGLIEFAIRNGLSFRSILFPLMHDIGEIRLHGWDYLAARKDGFYPAVSGFSGLASDSFGESEEDVPTSE
jgi:hypothetical protein